ncbi:hypothetical protein NECAME_09093 [Necator americanus]|uniref:Uncharacterized protein n=1 Tax=Necator americanus TaxID=51031 RepID=W2TEQ9_NECAM|nr:hypothetical protein NECAME_09093 [Necator americanus]ETN80545.1 hypothetical protein NECAME_09093 [Necator americanus]
MYDEKRIILIFKTGNESYALIPLEDTLEHWKEGICKHRLHRQEAVGKGLPSDNNQTLDSIAIKPRFEE